MSTGDAMDAIVDLHARLAAAERERDTLQAWIHDLQAGMYINCVYCGHRYGPEDEVPATMAAALKEHVERCPKHPMSTLRDQLARLRAIGREEWAETLWEARAKFWRSAKCSPPAWKDTIEIDQAESYAIADAIIARLKEGP